MKTILVVDDMAIFRDPISISLHAAGFHVLCAANGKEALELLKLHRPDLILLDLEMPIMDGLGFLRALRALPESRHVPVICLTSQADRDRVTTAAALGVRDYILKSRFSMKELLARIAKRLEAPLAKTPAAGAPKESRLTVPGPSMNHAERAIASPAPIS